MYRIGQSRFIPISRSIYYTLGNFPNQIRHYHSTSILLRSWVVKKPSQGPLKRNGTAEETPIRIESDAALTSILSRLTPEKLAGLNKKDRSAQEYNFVAHKFLQYSKRIPESQEIGIDKKTDYTFKADMSKPFVTSTFTRPPTKFHPKSFRNYISSITSQNYNLETQQRLTEILKYKILKGANLNLLALEDIHKLLQFYARYDDHESMANLLFFHASFLDLKLDIYCINIYLNTINKARAVYPDRLLRVITSIEEEKMIPTRSTYQFIWSAFPKGQANSSLLLEMIRLQIPIEDTFLLLENNDGLFKNSDEFFKLIEKHPKLFPALNNEARLKGFLFYDEMDKALKLIDTMIDTGELRMIHLRRVLLSTIRNKRLYQTISIMQYFIEEYNIPEDSTRLLSTQILGYCFRRKIFYLQNENTPKLIKMLYNETSKDQSMQSLLRSRILGPLHLKTEWFETKTADSDFKKEIFDALRWKDNAILRLDENDVNYQNVAKMINDCMKQESEDIIEDELEDEEATKSTE